MNQRPWNPKGLFKMTCPSRAVCRHCFRNRIARLAGTVDLSSRESKVTSENRMYCDACRHMFKLTRSPNDVRQICSKDPPKLYPRILQHRWRLQKLVSEGMSAQGNPQNCSKGLNNLSQHRASPDVCIGTDPWGSVESVSEIL